MTPSHTTRHGSKRYRYYTCSAAQKRGWHTCPSKAIPAAQLEQFVLEQMRCIGTDQAVLQEVLEQARAQEAGRTAELEAEQRLLERDLSHWHAEVRKVSSQLLPGDDNGPLIARLADLQERIGQVEERVRKVREQIRGLHQQLLDEDDAAVALSVFDPVWEALTPREQAQVVQLLVERVDYNGAKETVAITFHSTGIQTLADELARRQQEQSA
jgi:site-specific DNA recombinase